MPDTSMSGTIPPGSPLDPLIELLKERLTPPSELLDRATFASLLLIGETTLDKMRATGQIGPQPFKCGGSNTLRWHRPEILAWLANRDKTGELHTAETWPHVWASLQGRRVTPR
jgi:predicted DNA-binding transcriptional regulator AlpA